MSGLTKGLGIAALVGALAVGTGAKKADALTMDFFQDWYKVTVTQNDSDWSIKVLNTDVAYDPGKAGQVVDLENIFGGSVLNANEYITTIDYNVDGSKDYKFESPSFLQNISAGRDRTYTMGYQPPISGPSAHDLGSELFTVPKTLTISDNFGEHQVNILVGNYLGNGTYIENQPPVNPVPEPATILLFGAGLAGLATYGRRKK